jgi:hypothetical protein
MAVDSTSSVFDGRPEQWARMFDLDIDPGPNWRWTELGAIWRHQLTAPVFADLAPPPPARPGQEQLRIPEAARGTVRTFQDLLHGPRPPLELLELTKDFAKRHLSQPDVVLPRGIAMALYYASILLAWERHGRRITRLSKAQLCRGLAWVLDQPWLDRETRRLFHDGLAWLEAAER